MKHVFVLFFMSLHSFLSFSQTYNVMLVTGGHAYDTISFFQLFDELKGINYEHFAQPQANQKLVKDLAKDFDVIVFYDMWNEISEAEKAAYIKLTKQGKPLLFLHHSIASYQDWPEFEKIVGGRYFQKKKGIPDELVSSYEHDVWVYCTVENYTPVTSGLREPRFFDEVYGNVRISDDIKPLLRTRHPKSSQFVAWENNYRASKIIYLQPGHDKRTYGASDYKMLICQAIKYLAITN